MVVVVCRDGMDVRGPLVVPNAGGWRVEVLGVSAPLVVPNCGGGGRLVVVDVSVCEGARCYLLLAKRFSI